MEKLRQDPDKHAAHKAKIREQYHARKNKKLQQELGIHDVTNDLEAGVTIDAIIDRNLIDYKLVSALYDATECGDCDW